MVRSGDEALEYCRRTCLRLDMGIEYLPLKK